MNKRSWYVLYNGVYTECRFVSVNLLKHWMYLSVNGKTFKVVFTQTKDYEYAKRGNEVNAVANTRSQHKACKIIFK